MGGLKNKVNNILDPANILGQRPGGFDIRGALDPGGAILKATTGSDIGYKIADPGKLYQPKTIPYQQSAMDVYNAQKASRAAAASKKKLDNYYKLKGYSNILVDQEDLENFK